MVTAMHRTARIATMLAVIALRRLMLAVRDEEAAANWELVEQWKEGRWCLGGPEWKELKQCTRFTHVQKCTKLEKSIACLRDLIVLENMFWGWNLHKTKGVSRGVFTLSRAKSRIWRENRGLQRASDSVSLTLLRASSERRATHHGIVVVPVTASTLALPDWQTLAVTKMMTSAMTGCTAFKCHKFAFPLIDYTRSQGRDEAAAAQSHPRHFHHRTADLIAL